jgi:hypothetical protein
MQLVKITLVSLILCIAVVASAQNAPRDPVADYISEVQMILQRDFLVPRSIPESEREGLRVGVSVVIGANRRISSITITERSGHAGFDAAVERHIAGLLEANPRLPDPPRAARSQYVGVPITVSFVPPPPRAPVTPAETQSTALQFGPGY